MQTDRKSFHEVLDRILNNITDQEIIAGTVDIIVQTSDHYVPEDRFYRVSVQALCVQEEGTTAVQIDDLTKTYLVTDGESERTFEVPTI